MKKIKWLMAVSMTVSSTVFAQSMIEVVMGGQPLSYNKGGITDGCGVRVIGVLPADGKQISTVKTFDVSANYWKPGFSLGKVIGKIGPIDPAKMNQANRLPVYRAWLKAEGKAPMAPTQNSFKESPTETGAYLFATDAEGAIEFIVAVMKGNRVQVSLSWDGKTDRIYFGTVGMSEEDKRQVGVCLGEVLK